MDWYPDDENRAVSGISQGTTHVVGPHCPAAPPTTSADVAAPPTAYTAAPTSASTDGTASSRASTDTAAPPTAPSEGTEPRALQAVDESYGGAILLEVPQWIIDLEKTDHQASVDCGKGAEGPVCSAAGEKPDNGATRSADGEKTASFEFYMKSDGRWALCHAHPANGGQAVEISSHLVSEPQPTIGPLQLHWNTAMYAESGEQMLEENELPESRKSSETRQKSGGQAVEDVVHVANWRHLVENLQVLNIADVKRRLFDGSDSKDSKKKSEKKHGRLKYKLRYNIRNSKLRVQVIRCKGLPAVGRFNPYVKVIVLPRKKKTFETRVKRGNLNPIFNKTFTFKVPVAEIPRRTVVMAIHGIGHYLKPDMIGQVQIPLQTIDLYHGMEGWRSITWSREQREALGELYFELQYFQQNGTLTVHSLKGKNLKKMDVQGDCDPFIVIVLKIDGKATQEETTVTKMRTQNPSYKSSYDFELPFQQIETAQLKFTVFDGERMGIPDPIGTTIVGYKSTEDGRRHWMNMVARMQHRVAQWHSLQEVS